MTPWELTWAADVLAAFAPCVAEFGSAAQPALAPREGEVDYLRTWRRMREGATPLAAFGMRVALLLVTFAPFWLLGRWMTFSRLSRRDRTELLGKLLRHTSSLVRELALLLKFAAAVALLGTPSVRARSGYDKQQLAAREARAESSRRLPVLDAAQLASIDPRAAP